MEIKITLDGEFSPEDLEEMNDIATAAKDTVSCLKSDLESIQSDFSEYGELTIVPEAATATPATPAIPAKSPVTHRLPVKKVRKEMEKVLSEIFTSNGTRLQTVEMLRGHNKGQIALMWPSGGFLHNDAGTNEVNLQNLYKRANVPDAKRAIWKPTWRRNSW